MLLLQWEILIHLVHYQIQMNLVIKKYNILDILQIAEKCDSTNCLLNINFAVSEKTAEFTIVRADNGGPASYPLFITKLKIYGLNPSTDLSCSSSVININKLYRKQLNVHIVVIILFHMFR